jgi:hypothetical protein
MRKKCNNTSVVDYLTLDLSKVACHAAAEIYYQAVSKFGSSAFQSSGNFCEYNGPSSTCNSNTTRNQSCWTKGFSEENGGEMRCPIGKAAAGVWCVGSYCDNKHLYCKPAAYTSNELDTKWISEEQPNASFRVDARPNPSVIVGLKCQGSYCDNIKGYVGRVLDKEPSGAWQWKPWVSEERGLQKCGETEYLTGLGCKGSYCDELSLHCSAFKTRSPPR